MHPARLPLIVSVAALAVQMVAAAPVYSRYRGVSLGDTVTAAVASLNMTASEIAVVHVRPSLIQQLTWRPNQFFTGRTGKPDALAEMVLTFHLGRLARVVATYDRDRTEGLTNADLKDSFTAIYGPPMLVPTRTATRAGTATSDQPEIIGQWGDDETLVVLSRDVYPPRAKLTVSSVAAARQMQDAVASSVRLDALEAPIRDMVRRTSDELTRHQRAEQARVDNKAAFKP
jgi:hypothetical protein